MSIVGVVGGVLGGVAGGTVGGVAGGALGGQAISGVTSAAGTEASNAVLHGVSGWVLGGTRGAIQEAAAAISRVTAPNLTGTWFSATYWRVAALAAMLTIPFLCAAAVQAVARGDIGLLARAAFGQLPLAMLAITLAAPLTMLLLAATDQMSAVVSVGAANGGARFLDHAAAVAGEFSAAAGSTFFAVVVGLLTLWAALALAIELLLRAAAVYVVVLMLPLAFAAMVWPARRIWATRTVELLVSLILSKFAIVAVLSLAAGAFAHSSAGTGELLVAMSLLTLATFAPWVLMRILPFTELAAASAGILRGELTGAHTRALSPVMSAAEPAALMASALPARLRTHTQPEASTPSDNQPATGARADTTADGGETAAPEAPAPEPAAEPASAAPDPRGPYVVPRFDRPGQPAELGQQQLHEPEQRV